MQTVILFIISIYQRVFSPDHSFWAKAVFPNGYCKYYPTCSEYAKEAFTQGAAVRAIVLSTKRIVKCNPWSKGGFNYLKTK